MVIELGKIQTTCYQECNDSEVPECAESSGFGLGRLDQRIQPFEKAIVDMRLFPLHNAFPMSLDCASSLNHGLNPAVCRPEVPPFEHGFKEFLRRRFVNLLKILPDMKGLNGFQIQFRQG